MLKESLKVFKHFQNFGLIQSLINPAANYQLLKVFIRNQTYQQKKVVFSKYNWNTLKKSSLKTFLYTNFRPTLMY